MRKLVSVRQLVEDAEEDGKDPTYIMVDPDDLCEIDPDELADIEENPDDGDD